MERYFGGIKSMIKTPDIVIIIGQIKEITAVNECVKLKIPLISIVDTNCDPTLANFIIPANDDSISSVSLVIKELVLAINGEI